MLLIVIAMHAFFATGALLEQRMLVTFLKKVRIQGLNFNHLVTVRTLREQWAVLPEMQRMFNMNNMNNSGNGQQVPDFNMIGNSQPQIMDESIRNLANSGKLRLPMMSGNPMPMNMNPMNMNGNHMQMNANPIQMNANPIQMNTNPIQMNTNNMEFGTRPSATVSKPPLPMVGGYNNIQNFPRFSEINDDIASAPYRDNNINSNKTKLTSEQQKFLKNFFLI
jgi:hypothetical protein